MAGKIKISLCLISCMALFLVSCEDWFNSDQDRLSDEGNLFYDAAKNTLPSINASELKSFTSENEDSLTNKWGILDPLYLIFELFQEYDPEGFNTGVSGDNIYAFLYSTGSFFDETYNYGDTIPEQAINSPYDLGNNDFTYTVAKNDFSKAASSAVKKEGDEYYALHCTLQDDVSGVWTGTHHGITQGKYNKQTHDVAIDILTFSNLDVKDISKRIHIEGNDSTHQFTVKYIKYATANESFVYGVGHGYSRGEGAYFLFKFSVGENPDTIEIKDSYYCIPASATEQDLKNMNRLGSKTVIPECEVYQSFVDSLVPFTLDDIPNSITDFNKGGMGTASEGTIYLEYLQ